MDNPKMTQTEAGSAVAVPAMSASAHRHFLMMCLAALGVVYGDIGTSPLYAIKSCFDPQLGLAPTRDNVLGVLSLVFWALTLVISIKYIVFILRADNKGEGGIMALLALLIPRESDAADLYAKGQRTLMIGLGLFGAALLYGDGVITPAISVLSAVEGLQVATPAFQPIVVPLTVGILMLLFSVQSRGTSSIGTVFGPAMLVWFAVITALGLPWILRQPEVLAALNPLEGAVFLARNGLRGFYVLSAVVLCITGGEALYADMGHFGNQPIRFGWFGLVFPALLVNYFGQGAYILARGQEALGNPFYGMAPQWGLYPLVALATLATVIASQALISGAYSLTQQAVQLGYLPRLRILHTSRTTEGQIYAPFVNQLLMILSIALVIAFESSDRLAAAYGIAVTGTMTVTSVLFYSVIRQHWGWSVWRARALVAAFLWVDVAFFASNITKVVHGGWIPIALALGVYTLMTTWKYGGKALKEAMISKTIPTSEFLRQVAKANPVRVPGTAVFMSVAQDVAPAPLRHHFLHNQVLHERVILLTIVTEHVPEVESLARVRATELGEGFFKVVAHYGYMEKPDISEIIVLCESAGVPVSIEHLSFYLGSETVLPEGFTPLPRWRKRLYVVLKRNASPATEFFRIPPDRVIEIGSQVLI